MDVSISGTNPIDIQRQLERALGSEAWRLTPATFATTASYGAWKPAPHLQFISIVIATELAKGNARIIVSMPPRHGKSELLSVWTPTWLLDKDPSTEIILASYGSELATDFSRRVRDNIVGAEDADSEIKLNCHLRADAKRVNGFLTTEMGGMRAMGIQGTITGRGARVFLIDDYLKNPKDASSTTIRDDIWDAFRAVCRTRLEPGGSIIILATRWHLDDLIGRCITHGADEENVGSKWTYIDLAALALPDDLLGRKLGAPLWPTRWPENALAEIKHDLGTYFWECMYQQKPIPRSGGLISESDFPIVDVMPAANRLKSVRSWDLAGTLDDGDWSAGVLMQEDLYSGIFYVSDIKRVQLSAHELEELMLTTAIMDGPGTRIQIEQEPGSAGKNYLSYLCRKVLKGYNAGGERASGEKFVRAQPFYASAQAGSMRLKRAPWNKIFLEELMLFPDAPHDDMVDAASGAYVKLNEKVYQGTTFGRKGGIDPNASGPGVLRGPQHDKTEIVTGVTFGRNK